MTKHQPPKNFETSPHCTCPVAALALRFGAAEKDWNALDGHDLDVTDAAALNEVTMSALTDMASMSQPSSALGALFQVLIINHHTDLLFSLVDGDARRQARVDVVRLEGALWGIRRFLETHFGISATDIGGEYMMTESGSYEAKLRKAVDAAASPLASTQQQLLQAAE